jgi:hypothetical protein
LLESMGAAATAAQQAHPNTKLKTQSPAPGVSTRPASQQTRDKPYNDGTLEVENDENIAYYGEKNARGEKHGKGLASFASGDMYEGDWLNNKKHGMGCYAYANGAIYLGEYRYDNMHGKGVYVYAGGALYDGDFYEDVKNGTGTYLYSSGAIYQGKWNKNEMHGEGLYQYAISGDLYKGQFKNGKMDGAGYLKSMTIDEIQEGEFVAGEAVKMAVSQYTNFINFTFYDLPQIRSRKKTAIATVLHIKDNKQKSISDSNAQKGGDGAVIDGVAGFTAAAGTSQMRYFGTKNEKGERHGRGVLQYANGDLYDGEWNCNKKHGKGCYTYANGAAYLGEYKNGKMDGKGTYCFVDNAVYDGDFKEDVKCGLGKNGVLIAWSSD